MLERPRKENNHILIELFVKGECTFGCIGTFTAKLGHAGDVLRRVFCAAGIPDGGNLNQKQKCTEYT